GEYTAALDWFRNVYDYALPAKKRKIYYGLKSEEQESSNYKRPANWLLDPLNPHEIASTRRNTYTRFTVMSIVRCFQEYADSQFTLDTPESVRLARELYLTARNLLDTDELHQTLGPCDDVIGNLGIQVGDPIWAPVWSAVQKQLRMIDDQAAMSAAAGKIQAIMNGAGPLPTRLGQAQSVAAAAKALPAPPRVSNVVNGKADLHAGVHAALLSRSAVSGGGYLLGALAPEYFPRGPPCGTRPPTPHPGEGQDRHAVAAPAAHRARRSDSGRAHAR